MAVNIEAVICLLSFVLFYSVNSIEEDCDKKLYDTARGLSEENAENHCYALEFRCLFGRKIFEDRLKKEVMKEKDLKGCSKQYDQLLSCFNAAHALAYEGARTCCSYNDYKCLCKDEAYKSKLGKLTFKTEELKECKGLDSQLVIRFAYACNNNYLDQFKDRTKSSSLNAVRYDLTINYCVEFCSSFAESKAFSRKLRDTKDFDHYFVPDKVLIKKSKCQDIGTVKKCIKKRFPTISEDCMQQLKTECDYKVNTEFDKMVYGEDGLSFLHDGNFGNAGYDKRFDE